MGRVCACVSGRHDQMRGHGGVGGCLWRGSRLQGVSCTEATLVRVQSPIGPVLVGAVLDSCHKRVTYDCLLEHLRNRSPVAVISQVFVVGLGDPTRRALRCSPPWLCVTLVVGAALADHATPASRVHGAYLDPSQDFGVVRA